MRSPLRLLALTLVVSLVAAGSAQAVVFGNPEFTFSPFTKAQTGAGNVVTTTLIWLPPKFDPPPGDDKQEITVQDLTVGGSTTFSAGDGTIKSAPLMLVNGHSYAITVAACETVTCVLGGSGTNQATGTTRVDATPPSGTVQINDGAVATNNRNVTLNLEATDPLIGGAPGTSSGITQSAVDVDGDGTFPCTIVFVPTRTPDSSGCAQAFKPATPATLTAGDGVKTVGVKFGDGARPNTAPCPPFPIVCAILLLGSPILGNESAVATDTILLDTVKPTAVVKQDRTTVNRGDQVNFDAGASTDQASGIDLPTAAWQWKDGTPATNGAKVSHVFNQAGTFVGELRVKDVAGNTSDPRSFTITVNAPGGASGGSSIGGLTGKAAFKIDRLKVNSRFVKARFRGSIVTRLKGSIVISGTTTRKGALRADLRRTPKGRLLARIKARKLKVGPFTRTFKLPANLKPGSYKLAFVGPGGTLRFTLKLAR